MGYHAKYFNALAFWHMAENSYKTAEDKAKGMGEALGQLRICVIKYEEARPFVNLVGGTYKTNFDKKLGEAVALRDKAEQMNKSVYYEAEPAADTIKKPDPQNFVNLVTMQDEINAIPDLDNRLRHLVPPAVRSMADELRNVLQGTISEEFSKIQ